MDTKPINPNQRLDTLFPSPWLKAQNLMQRSQSTITLTISRIAIVTVQPKPAADPRRRHHQPAGRECGRPAPVFCSKLGGSLSRFL